MSRVRYVLFLCIGILFISVLLEGCSGKSQDTSKITPTAALPAVEVVSINKISPSKGTSLDKAKEIVAKYLKDKGVQGDLQARLSIDEITIKEAWENIGIQLYNVSVDTADIYCVAVLKDNRVIDIIEGMPVFEKFLADIDSDGKYEIYANTSFGSGIVSNDISGYNVATNTKYFLSKRMEKDYKLIIKGKELMTKEYSYKSMHTNFDTTHEIKALEIKRGKLTLAKPTYGFAVY